MTLLEIALIATIWIGYGLFAAYQSRDVREMDDNTQWFYFPVCAPIIFICKALYGAFKKYE